MCCSVDHTKPRVSLNLILNIYRIAIILAAKQRGCNLVDKSELKRKKGWQSEPRKAIPTLLESLDLHSSLGKLA